MVKRRNRKKILLNNCKKNYNREEDNFKRVLTLPQLEGKYCLH